MGNEQGHFGCEFVDDGGYGNLPYRYVIQQPWKTHPLAASFRIYTIGFLRNFADPKRLQAIEGNLSRRNELWSDIALYGIKHPFILEVDPTYKARLRDGHHRLLTLADQPWYPVPVRIDSVDNIRGRFPNFMDVIEGLL